ncbi:hypothetical protein [Cryptosporangium arvum]|uniref:Lipoprotein n=1 Tax=Cryptosporangium arvum DSM 44712 TaxID=927661 RepID=A0A010ZMC3_9ACTN|nr:hypothetical protein [Cryptosporangium arvum]EXG79794.1 hypothetical protein CryarDRAFT_0840 [Cryptosporangium arvum DSM 44712]
MFRITALALVGAAVLAGCGSAPEAPGAAQALVAGDAQVATLEGNVWQPVDLTGCSVPWGLAVMVEESGISRREFTFTTHGSIQVRQVEVPDDPDTGDAYALAYSREGSTLRVRAGLGIEAWTIRELTSVRLLLEDENGDECWLRRVR